MNLKGVSREHKNTTHADGVRMEKKISESRSHFKNHFYRTCHYELVWKAASEL
jgi:hypothetical protein